MKYTVEYCRKDGVSEKAFIDWFINQFLPRAVPIMRKHNILQYAIVSAVPAPNNRSFQVENKSPLTLRLI